VFTSICDIDDDVQPPPKSKGGKMLALVNWRLKVTLNDGRALTGQMLAFDRHMNLVLAECEEFRRIRPKKKAGETEAGPMQEMKRALGLVILRGETVVSISVEGPPPEKDDDKKGAVCETNLNHGFFSLIMCTVAPGRAWSWHACRSWARDDASECVSFFDLSLPTLNLAPSVGGGMPPPMGFGGPPGMPGPPPGFRPPGMPPGMPFAPPPGFGGPPPGLVSFSSRLSVRH
jgi:small nuclear ribonucleoprotein B and B'